MSGYDEQKALVALRNASAAADAGDAAAAADARRIAQLINANRATKPLPGLGENATTPTRQEELQALRANQPPDSVSGFAGGVLQGAKNTALGVGQLSAHVNPTARAADLAAQQMGQPSPIGALDQYIAQSNAAYAAQPESQTFGAKAGEFVGGTLATAPLAAVAVPARGAGITSALVRGGLGGGALAATQPVSGNNFAAEKAGQFGTGAAFGTGVTGGLRGLGAIAERVYAPNVMAQVANYANQGANREPFAAEGEQLAQRTGIPLTPGQVSGSRVQTGLENMTRQSFFSADRALQADQRVANGTIRYVNKLMDNLTQNPASEAAIGSQIQTATRNAVTKIAEQRDKIAAQQYGAIDAAVGNKPFIQPTATIQAADDIIAQYRHVPTPEAARIVAQAQALRDRLAKKAGYTFKQAQDSRAYYGKAAKGGASVFDEVSHDLNRRLAAKIYGAMSSDIENSAANLSGRGPGLVPANTVGLQEAIKQANDNYRKYSQLIDATESHPIARLFGDKIAVGDVVQFDKIPPETVIARLGQMRPTELRMVREFMERNAPESWQQYKRLLVDKALAQAQTLPTSMGANTVPFNAAAFVRTLGGDKPDKIKQLQAVFSADEFAQIDDAFQASRRLGDKFGYNFSGTGPYMEVQNLLNSIKNRAFAAAASTGGEALGLRKVANVMLNADGRRALIELSKLPPRSKQAASLVSLLAALSSGQGMVNPGADQNANKQNAEAEQPR